MVFARFCAFVFCCCVLGTATGAVEWDCSATNGVFTLSSDCLVGSAVVVTGTLHITGADGYVPKILGNGSTRLFQIRTGGRVSLTNLLLTGGRVSVSDCAAPYSGCGGGAVHVENGQLNVTKCSVTDNAGYYGGAIFGTGQAARLTVDSTQFAGNNAVVMGAGIMIRGTSTTPGGILAVANSTFSGNTVSSFKPGYYSGGGGIMCVHPTHCTLTGATLASNVGLYGGGMVQICGTLLVSMSTFSNNEANGGGGGLFFFCNHATKKYEAQISVRDSVIKENKARNRGGGFLVAVRKLTVARTTFQGNKVTVGSQAGDGGGALRFNGKDLTGTTAEISIIESTFLSNHAPVGRGKHLDVYSTPDWKPKMFIANSQFSNASDFDAFRSHRSDASVQYSGTESCETVPSQCVGMGYIGHACVDKEVGNEGVECTRQPAIHSIQPAENHSTAGSMASFYGDRFGTNVSVISIVTNSVPWPVRGLTLFLFTPQFNVVRVASL
jgi:hypothetical protein